MISIPFSGSKRYSYKHVKKIVQEGEYESVFEPFGGSCVLSVNLFYDGLVKRAVANDYDHFFDDYLYVLDLKDKVVELGYKAGLRRTVRNHNGTFRINPDGSREKVSTEFMPPEECEILQNIVKENVPEKYYKKLCLGANFIFSARTSDPKVYLKDFKKFASYLKTDKQRAFYDELQKIELDHLDYRDFLDKYKDDIKSGKNILILDPPYTGTYQLQYEGAFTDEDTKELIEKVKELNCDFIFFNHDEEKVRDWLDGLDYELQLTGNSASTATRNRKDVMAYVKRSGI